MEIQTRTRCETCHGKGSVYNPTWDEWTARHEDDPIAAGPMPTEPERLACGDCDTQGYIYEWRDLASLLRVARS